MFKGYKRSIPKPWDFLVSLTIIHHKKTQYSENYAKIEWI